MNLPVTDEFLRGMARGVRIHNETTLPCRTRKIARFGFSIVLTQGLNRQIRLMSAAFGYRVTQLRRIRIANNQNWPRSSRAAGATSPRPNSTAHHCPAAPSGEPEPAAQPVHRSALMILRRTLFCLA